jgi:hypothetical protein
VDWHCRFWFVLVSPNGQETKYHFTINNSPLPSNVINDVVINNLTGEVFIATQRIGIFKGTATTANDDLSKVYVYPNPYDQNIRELLRLLDC